jgi:hypothetical protein
MKPILNKKSKRAQPTQGSQIRRSQTIYLLKQNAPALIVLGILIVCVMTAPTFGITVKELRDPIKNLRDDLFGGWMWVAKIGAAVGGCVMAVYQRDVVPLATGAAVGLGIHFYDAYFKDSATTTAALI